MNKQETKEEYIVKAYLKPKDIYAYSGKWFEVHSINFQSGIINLLGYYPKDETYHDDYERFWISDVEFDLETLKSLPINPPTNEQIN